MKWVTREHPKTDRIACPWLIRTFIDPAAEIVYLPADQVLAFAQREGAISFDAAGARYSHRDGLCSFEVLVEEYALGGDPSGGTTGTTILPKPGRSPANTLQIRFTRYQDRSDLTLTVQASDSPAAWTDLARSTAGAPFVLLAPGAAATETGTGNTRQVTVTDLYPVTDPAHPRRFMRLKITITGAN